MPDPAGGTVVITYGTSGLGSAIALRFARSQARVVIADQDAAAGARAVGRLHEQGFSAVYRPLHVGHPENSHGFVQKLVQEVGTIKLWINGLPPVLSSDNSASGDDAWKQSVSALSTAFHCSRAIAEHMRGAGGGVLVNLTSLAGYLPAEGHVSESVAAAGLVAMTQALGIEWASRGVRVVGIAVGAIASDGQVIGAPESPHAEQLRTPLRRLGSVEEVAEATFFIASDAASYIVAETLRVDGGWSAYQMF
jgi:NAD(P)-dependent dehydrogenase (short-subunit alcohol dehydrogenase family)